MSEGFKRSNFGNAVSSGTTSNTGTGTGSQSNKKNVGGIWKGTTKTESTYLSISLDRNELIRLIETSSEGDRIKLVAFENGNKSEERHPDFRIFQSN